LFVATAFIASWWCGLGKYRKWAEMSSALTILARKLKRREFIWEIQERMGM
jgi:hypothetical protein